MKLFPCPCEKLRVLCKKARFFPKICMKTAFYGINSILSQNRNRNRNLSKVGTVKIVTVPQHWSLPKAHTACYCACLSLSCEMEAGAFFIIIAAVGTVFLLKCRKKLLALSDNLKVYRKLFVIWIWIHDLPCIFANRSPTFLSGRKILLFSSKIRESKAANFE